MSFEAPKHDDLFAKKKTIVRNYGVSNLHQPPLDKQRSPDMKQCQSASSEQLNEPKTLALHSSTSTLGDEGYDSRRNSGRSILSFQSQISLESTLSVTNMKQILENDEDPSDSEGISFTTVDNKNDEDSLATVVTSPGPKYEHSSPTEESESLITKMCSLNLSDNEPNVQRNFQKQSASLHPRRHSDQHPYPLPSPRTCNRRSSEATLFIGGRPFLKILPLQPEEGPTCIMCRRNSLQMSSPTPKRKLSSTRSYIFKATPIRRWNSEIFTVSPMVSVTIHTPYAHT